MGRAWFDPRLAAEIIDLIAIVLVADGMHEAIGHRLFLIRDQGGQPVFVGDPDPATDGTLLDIAVFLQVVVVDLAQGAVEHPKRALMQNVEAESLRRSGSRDQPIGEQRHALGAGIPHPLGRGHHIAVVESENPLEHQPLAIVPGQGHRLLWGQRAAIRGPDRVGARELHLGVRADPAELGIVGFRRANGAQKMNLVRCGIDFLAIVFEDDVVDTAALERDGPGNRGGIDGDARGRLDRLGALGGGDDGGSHRRRANRATGHRDRGRVRSRRRRGAVGVERRRRLARRELLLAGLFLLHLGELVQELKAEQDHQRQRDGDYHVLLVAHVFNRPVCSDVPSVERGTGSTPEPPQG